MDNKTAQQANVLANFVWQIAEILRGDFKQSEYGKVILPFVVLRRLDCILEPSKDAVRSLRLPSEGHRRADPRHDAVRGHRWPRRGTCRAIRLVLGVRKNTRSHLRLLADLNFPRRLLVSRQPEAKISHRSLWSISLTYLR